MYNFIFSSLTKTACESEQPDFLLSKNEALMLPKSLMRQDSVKSKSKDSKLSSGKSTISSANSLYLACEVASLSSFASDYSQFDFLTNNSNNSNNNNTNISSGSGSNAIKVVLPVSETYHVDTSPSKKSANNSHSNGGLTSFFFSNR